MNFNEYQKVAKSFDFSGNLSREEKIVIWALGVAGEGGEVADHIKKALRGDCSLKEKKEDVLKEMGDVLWYLALLAKAYDTTLEDVAHINISKLASRNERKVMRGSGDYR